MVTLPNSGMILWNHLSIAWTDPRWIHIKEKAIEEGKVQVNQYWMIENSENQRQWDFQEKPKLTSMDDWGDFQEEMIQHFVKVKKGLDILRWGYTNQGSISIKESYNITLGNHEEDDGIWKKKWTVNLWPKVSLFAWLVVRVSILTNENLRLCGVQGPS